MQVDAKKQWHVVDLAMSDRSGTLSTVLDAIEADPIGSDHLEYAAALGISFGGYATMKLVVGAGSGTTIDTALIRRRLRGLGRRDVVYAQVTTTPLDVRNAPVRTVTQIYELMFHLALADVQKVAGSVASKCHTGGLSLMLLHVPSSPPPMGAHEMTKTRLDDPSYAWLRIRIGVPQGRWTTFQEIVKGVTKDIIEGNEEEEPPGESAIDPAALIRVSSVAEFARPSTGAQPGGGVGEHWLEVEDRSASSGKENVTFVFVDTPVRRGVMSAIFAAIQPFSADLRGASSYSMVGRSFTTLYFDGEPDRSDDRTWRIENQIRIALGKTAKVDPEEVKPDVDEATTDPQVVGVKKDPKVVEAKESDPNTFVTQKVLPGWPGIGVSSRTRPGPGMRLVWQAPNVPGVLSGIMTTLHALPGRANTSYVLSRVSDVDVSLGRLVLRLEDKSAVIDMEIHDAATQVTRLEEHARLLSMLMTRRLERLVQAARDADPSHPLRERDVFVAVDLFRQSEQESSGT